MKKQSPVASVRNLTAEYGDSPLGIAESTPRLSWEIDSDTDDFIQKAYEIQIFDSEGNPREEQQKVETRESNLQPWPFAPLHPRERVSLRLRVYTGEDSLGTDWSDALELEAPLLQASDWQATFISPESDSGSTNDAPAPYLRKDFDLKGDIRFARLYVTSLGLHRIHINGLPVGDSSFDPGWTAYDHRLTYRTCDVTALLQEGGNCLAAILADGWFRGRLGFEGGTTNIWGKRLALLSQLEVTYSDGSRDVVGSDESWTSGTGGLIRTGIYDGEEYDANIEPQKWKLHGFDDSSWQGVQAVDHDMGILEPRVSPPVRSVDILPPQSMFTSPAGNTIVDFGQNLVGRVRISVPGKPGDKITIRHAEVLENGELGIRPLRKARATDVYVPSGDDIEEWEPEFTYHGFRYAEISGWPGELRADDISAVAIHSDMERRGWFECSDDKLNRLHENIRWSMKGNFFSVPTDCPQRDERLGWTGDIQVFAPTASYLYDTRSFLGSWLKDLEIEQKKLNGEVPPIVPNALNDNFGAAAWADAAVIVPWSLYETYGDRGVLSKQFDSMRSWVDHVESVVGDSLIWDRGFQFGDWLDPTAPPEEPWKARTDKEIVATAYFARSAELTAAAAEVLDRTEVARHYQKLSREITDAFNRQFVTPAGRLMSDTETAYSLALTFNLLNVDQRETAGKRLAELVMEAGYRIRTGFVGTPIICEALSSTGHFREAYRLLMQEECPSWLYPVSMGATSIWERWDSMLSDGSINPGEMTSFNHYALGAVGDWMHRYIGGIAPAAPGYRTIRFAPRPGGGVSWGRGRYRTPYGPTECRWKIDSGTFTIDVVIPPGCRGEVHLPGSDAPEWREGGSWSWSIPYTDPDMRAPFTVDDQAGEILAAEGGGAVIGRILGQLNAPDYLKALAFGEKKQTLRQAMNMLPDPRTAIDMMNQAMKELGGVAR